MDKDKLTTLIKDIINEEIARLISFCKTQPPAAQIAAMQAVNVRCDPPDEWGELVYNGELCKMVRADPTLADFRCEACYACCIRDVTQNAFISIKGDCNIGRDALAAAVSSLKAALAFRLPKRTERDIMNIDLLSTSVGLDNIPAALQKIVILQKINVSEVGAISAIKQSIAAELLFNSTVSATTKMAIDTYIKEFLAYVPPAASVNLPTPAPLLQDLLPNSITTAADAAAAKAAEDARLMQLAGAVSNSSPPADTPKESNDTKTPAADASDVGGGDDDKAKDKPKDKPKDTEEKSKDGTDKKALSDLEIMFIVFGVIIFIIVCCVVAYKVRKNRQKLGGSYIY